MSPHKKLLLCLYAVAFLASCATTKQNSTPIQLPAEVKTTPIETKPEKLANIANKHEKSQPINNKLPEIEPTFWQALIEDFRLPAIHHPAIDKEFTKLLSSPTRVKQNIETALPLLAYVLTEIKQRDLPTELALIPFVESNYQVTAKSSSNAKGLWQIMPKTATSLGLNYSWWQDDSYNVVLSTTSALDYLTAHYSRFNDWIFAIAAYNAGPYRIAKSLRALPSQNSATHPFFDLALPKETRSYLPRLLAYKKLILQHKKLDHIFNPSPQIKDIAALEVKRQTSLTVIAEIADIDATWLKKYNPGYPQWATPPEGTAKLLLPKNKAKQASKNLPKLSQQQRLPWFIYTIQPGDTLSQIAQAHQTSTKQIKQLNNLSNNKIIAGKSIKIPAAKPSDNIQKISK